MGSSVINQRYPAFKGISVIPGIVDNNYTGPVIIQAYNIKVSQAMTIRDDLPLSQIVIQPYIAVILDEQDYSTPTTRGWNAFGATGFKNRGIVAKCPARETDIVWKTMNKAQ
jgi:dUTPase